MDQMEELSIMLTRLHVKQLFNNSIATSYCPGNSDRIQDDGSIQDDPHDKGALFYNQTPFLFFNLVKGKEELGMNT